MIRKNIKRGFVMIQQKREAWIVPSVQKIDMADFSKFFLEPQEVPTPGTGGPTVS